MVGEEDGGALKGILFLTHSSLFLVFGVIKKTLKCFYVKLIKK